MMIYIGPKFCAVPSLTPRSPQGQGHGLRIFMLNYYIKIFKTSLFPNHSIDLVHIWYDDKYWSKVLRSTILVSLGHPKVKGHGHRIFELKFYVKVNKTSLFPNHLIDLLHVWYDDTYWSKVLHSTINNQQGHLKVNVMDLEFM